MAKWFTTFTKGLIKQVAFKKGSKIVGASNVDDFIEKWKNLQPDERDFIRKYLRRESREYIRLQKMVREGLIKKELNRALSSSDGEIIDMYEQFFMFENEVERYDINSKSGNFKYLEYHPKTKICFICMENGRLLYPFFNVPKTKAMVLADIGGTYMWNYFGKHYSANPQNWIRK